MELGPREFGQAFSAEDLRAAADKVRAAQASCPLPG